MAHFPFQNDELEYVDEFYEMSDFEDEGFSLSGSVNSTPKSKIRNHDNCFDSDVDDDDDDEFLVDSVKSKTDTTANEARNGKDIQGIPWERLNFTRDKYRETRLKQYKNFDSLAPSSRDELLKVCKKVEKGYKMYDFQFNTRLVKSTIVHFQDGLFSEQQAPKGNVSVWYGREKCSKKALSILATCVKLQS